MPINAGLISLGGYLPAKRVTEAQRDRLVHFLASETLLPADYIDQIRLSGRLPGSVETNLDGWINQPWFETWLKNLPGSKRNEPFQGTKERRRVPFDPGSLRGSIVPHPMLPSDAETLAGALAIIHSGVPKDDIELLLVHSQIPDRLLPPNASLVQHKLKLKNAGAYSVDSCCSSFVTMLEIASGLIKAGLRSCVLIVCSYIDSHVIDRSTYYSVNTGDAAVAAIVSRVPDDFGYISSASTSHGSRHEGIILQRRPPTLLKKTSLGADRAQEFTTFYDLGACREISSNAERDMVEVVQKALCKADLTIGDLDFFVTHQPVTWAAKAWRDALGIPENKSYESFETYGNVATCSVPVNLLEATEKNLIKAGDRVLLASSGAGENHIAVLERVSSRLVQSIQTSLA
jgi:3-oxoacyl-[acyl-carrier-protein] synthase III